MVNHQIAANSVYLNLNRIMWQPWPGDPNWLGSRSYRGRIWIFCDDPLESVQIKLQMIWASWSFASRRRGEGEVICKLTYHQQKLASHLFPVTNQGCRICGSVVALLPGIFFGQALLHDLRDFYTILRDFCAILHDFYTILRNFYAILHDFCDFYAIFCQAPKTIMQAWQQLGRKWEWVRFFHQWVKS